MTIINIIKKESIEKIEIKGHTGYDEFGKDILCAAISSIVTTTVNAIIRFNKNAINYKVDDAEIVINVLKHDNVVDTLIVNMVDELKSLSKQYKQNIKINI